MGENNRFSSGYTFSEGRTGGDQLVEFTCRPEEVEQVKEFLKIIRTIDIPTTGRVAVGHGGYSQYTRYNITQHKYAAGGQAYIEVLEIKNPPDGRCGIVINEYHNGDSVFTEWHTLEHALEAYEKGWGSWKTDKVFPTLKGFVRRVICNVLTPWFYAIGDEELVGDYTFPRGLQDDVVYRFGRKFVVSDRDGGTPEIKTCMGTCFYTEKGTDGYGREKKYYHRFVYWDDGSFFDAHNYTSNPPYPLEESELWIMEAICQFKKEILTGNKKRFTINFIGG